MDDYHRSCVIVSFLFQRLLTKCTIEFSAIVRSCYIPRVLYTGCCSVTLFLAGFGLSSYSVTTIPRLTYNVHCLSIVPSDSQNVTHTNKTKTCDVYH